MTYEEELMELMKRDTGRGLLNELPAVDLRQVDEAISSAQRVIILTGFPVRGAQVRGETDGPSGTANLAAALLACGCQVWIVTDETSSPLLQAAVETRAPGAQVICVEEHPAADCAAWWMDRIAPTHVISLERPGKAADGHFYNMRGLPIDDMVTDTEDFFQEAVKRGIPTLAIGDGGNELGMDNYRPQVCRFVPKGERICARQGADWTLPAGISNWWGWGLASMLSLKWGKMLLPSPEEERSLLKAVVDAGGVDGCTGRSELSVDNMELSAYLKVLAGVRELTEREMDRRRIAVGE